MKNLILEFTQPEEGSFDMGYSRAYGYRIYQEGGKFYREDWTAGGSDFVTRVDGSTFFLDHEPINQRTEISPVSLRKEIERSKKDKRFTVRKKLRLRS